MHFMESLYLILYSVPIRIFNHANEDHQRSRFDQTAHGLHRMSIQIGRLSLPAEEGKRGTIFFKGFMMVCRRRKELNSSMTRRCWTAENPLISANGEEATVRDPSQRGRHVSPRPLPPSQMVSCVFQPNRKDLVGSAWGALKLRSI